MMCNIHGHKSIDLSEDNAIIADPFHILSGIQDEDDEPRSGCFLRRFGASPHLPPTGHLKVRRDNLNRLKAGECRRLFYTTISRSLQEAIANVFSKSRDV